MGVTDGSKRVVLAAPRSFCAGVRRAVEVVEEALSRHGTPVYVRKQIVHNAQVVSELMSKGAVFVDSEDEVPPGAVCVFSAHGVAPAVRRNAEARSLQVIDATCPLVTKVHTEARRFARDGRTIVLIGHRDHEEIEGTLGEAPERTVVVGTTQDVAALRLPRDTPVAYLTQTTLSVDDAAALVAALRERFDDVVGPGSDDICYASQNRQNAVRRTAECVDVLLVVGSPNSSNSLRMVEVSLAAGTPAHLVPDVSQLDVRWLEGAVAVGVSAGASAPESQVQQLLARLAGFGYRDVEVVQVAEERVVFAPPAELTGAAR